MKLLLVVVAVGALAAGCSGSGTAKHLAAPPPKSTVTTHVSETTSTTTAASTCTASSGPGKASGGSGDVTPPGDIPDNQAFVTYPSAAGRYSVKVPEGWARSEAGPATTFTDKLNTIRIEVLPAASAPTTASVAQEESAVQAQVRCFEAPQVSTVQRKAGPAVLLTFRADSTPDPVTGKTIHDDVERYEFWKAGTQAVITLSSPRGSDNVDPWRTVTDSFAWTS